MENSDNSDIFFQQGIGIGPFQMMNEIGKGEFGKVYIGIHEETKEKVAIKQIQKSNEKVNMNSIRSEINIQKKLFHPYLCKMYCVIDIPDYIFIVTEYCGGGEILKTMEEQDAPFEERMACKIFTQVLSGIEYLHNNYICHRDIKLENMLFDEYGDAKLTDFGLSKSFEGNITFDKAVGSALYSAPEVFTGKPYIGKNADLWSMGVCLYVMVCGEYPFKGEELDDFLKNLFNDSFDVPDSVSPEYKDLIYRILEKDPNKRLNVEQIKRHNWLHMFDFNFMKSPGIIINTDILPIDINVVTEMVGYDENKIRNLINDILINKHNNNTISYYLRIESLKRNKGSSISDIRPSSELFLIYINDKKSKMKNYDNDINKKIDELVKNIINGHKMEQLKIREKIKNSLNIEKSKTINYKNNNKIINKYNVGDNNNNKDNNKKNVNNKIKMNYQYNALLSKTYRNFEDFKKMLKKDDEEKKEKVEKIKKNKIEILTQYIGPLLLVHNIIDEIITNVVILKNTKEIKRKIIPVNNSSLNVLSTKPKNKFEPIIIENNNITITPLEKINLNSKYQNFSMDKIEEIEYLPNNTNSTMVKTFTNGFPKDRNEKGIKSSKNIKFQNTERKMNIINENDEIKNHKKINTIFSSENYRKGKNVNDTKNNNNNGIGQRNERKRAKVYLKKNKSDLSCVLKNTNFSKVIKGLKEKITKNGILKKNKKIKRSLSQKKTEKKINILHDDDEINKYLKERKKNKSEKIINKIKLFSIDIIEKKEKKSDLKYLYANNEKNQKLLLSKRINRNQKPNNPKYDNYNDNLDENLNINEISSEKKINRKKENNSMMTRKEEQKFVRHKKNLYSSQIDFFNSKSNISINFDRKKINTITLENSSRKNNNQGRTLLIKRNKNKKKEKINDESNNMPNTPMAHTSRRLGDIKTTIFSNTKNPKNACQTGRNQKKPENSDKTISHNDSVIKKKNEINDKNIKSKSNKSNSIHLKNNLAKKNETKNDNNNLYEIKTKKNENLIKNIIVDYVGNNNTTISIIGKGQTKFSCKIFIGRKKVVCNIKMVQQEKNEYIITGEFLEGDIQNYEKIFEQIKEKLE